MRRVEMLQKVIEPIISGLGFTWVGLQYLPQGRHSLIRLYVDKPGGIGIEDCARVSRQVNAVLGVENLLTEEYTLEVSSPGLDRLLFTPAQCGEQIGKLVSIRLIVPIEGKRNFKGKVARVQEDTLFIVTESGEVKFSFVDIEEVRIVPEW